MGQPIVHFEIMGGDETSLRSFYAQLFGWKIAEPMAELGGYALVDGETSGLAGGIGPEMGGGKRVTVYVQVPDLQATLDQAVSLGATVVMPPTDIPQGNVSLAMFSDPAGNVTGLVKG